jgi:hypothetical protein
MLKDRRLVGSVADRRVFAGEPLEQNRHARGIDRPRLKDPLVIVARAVDIAGLPRAIVATDQRARDGRRSWLVSLFQLRERRDRLEDHVDGAGRVQQDFDSVAVLRHHREDDAGEVCVHIDAQVPAAWSRKRSGGRRLGAETSPTGLSVASRAGPRGGGLIRAGVVLRTDSHRL